MMNMSPFLMETSSSSSKSPIHLKVQGSSWPMVKLESRVRSSKSDEAWSSQTRLQDAYLDGLMDTATGKLVATNDESGDDDVSESEIWSFQEEAVCPTDSVSSHLINSSSSNFILDKTMMRIYDT